MWVRQKTHSLAADTDTDTRLASYINPPHNSEGQKKSCNSQVRAQREGSWPGDARVRDLSLARAKGASQTSMDPVPRVTYTRGIHVVCAVL